MSVITEKDIISNIEYISVAERVKNKLFEKQTMFFESVFPKYSHKEKAAYMDENSIGVGYLLTIFLTIICSFMLLIGTSFSFDLGFHYYLNALFCVMGSIFILFLSCTPFLKRIAAKKWLSKEKNNNFLRNAMFWNSSVDKETMKYFIQNYGKEHFVSLMKGKENLKYKDIFFYIKELNNENSETANLSKVAECLLKN